jgi:mono/diheme cytochrome c family protein
MTTQTVERKTAWEGAKMVIALAAALALLLLLALFGAAGAQEPAAEGKQYFVSNGCYGCHTVGRTGTPIGPDLSHVGGKYSLAYLQRWLRDPAAQRPSAHMPALELSEAQVTALAAYLSTLQ